MTWEKTLNTSATVQQHVEKILELRRDELKKFPLHSENEATCFQQTNCSPKSYGMGLMISILNPNRKQIKKELLNETPEF